jgi:hypothetical protein
MARVVLGAIHAVVGTFLTPGIGVPNGYGHVDLITTGTLLLLS